MPSENEAIAPAGTEQSTLYVAVEVSRKVWVVGLKSPLDERIGVHSIGAVDVEGFKGLIEYHRAKAERAIDRKVRTVRYRSERVFTKFGVSRRADAVRRARALGILDPD